MEDKTEFENKTVFNKKLVVGSRVIAITRNVGKVLTDKEGKSLEEPVSYDSLKIRDVDANFSIKLTDEILACLKEAIAKKVD